MNLIRHEFGVAVDRPGAGPLLLRHFIGIGMNYAEHAREQGKGVPERPVLFTKNPGAACLNGDQIVVPRVCQDREQVDFEAELAFIIAHASGRPSRDVPRDSAFEHVLGYCCANDVSARWWQKDGAGGQFCRGKSFDTFCPLGPRVVPMAEVADPNRLRVACRVNGVTMQDANTSDMIFDVATLVHECTRGTSLLPGTVILTGTPSGVGFARKPPVFLKAGDTVEVEVESIGTLKNTVRFE